jgi:hypothetical protein
MLGPVLAGFAMLLGSFWASGMVVEEGLSPFDTPYEPASVSTYFHQIAADFPVMEQKLGSTASTVPPERAVNVFETTQKAGDYIMATGREYLPVGGFGGATPSTTLPTFEHLVADQRVRRVTVVTQPLTNEPVLRWVVQHCADLGLTSYDKESHATSTMFDCRPGDAPAS